jgi:hypothetical protein
MADSIEQYQAAVHEMASKVEQLIIKDPTARKRFTKHIDRFCKMVEGYGQALLPYAQKLAEAKEKDEPLPLPPPKGWVEMSPMNGDTLFVGKNMRFEGQWLNYRQVEPPNPLLWLGLFGIAGLQRKPKDNEILMCEYVRLAIIHDIELKPSLAVTPFFSAKYEGKWFERDRFSQKVWKYYYYPYEESPLFHRFNAQEKLSQLDCAFQRVQADLIGKQPPEQNRPEDSDAETKEQPWRDDAPDYMENSEAVSIFTGSKMPLPTLSNMLRKPGNAIRWMRKGRRSKVHIGDFGNYAKRHYVSDELANEIADEVLADREAQQEQENLHKRKTGK